MMYSPIVTAKMNNVDPQAWLADVLARIAAHPVQRLDELLPWNWRAPEERRSGSDLSPNFHPLISRVSVTFEPNGLGGATGRGAEPSA